MEDLSVIKNLLTVITIVVPACLVLVVLFLYSIIRNTELINSQLFHLRNEIESIKDRVPTLEECVSLTNSLTSSVDALTATNSAILANNNKPQQRKPKNERKTNKVKA